jgi:hypothetical protein
VPSPSPAPTRLGELLSLDANQPGGNPQPPPWLAAPPPVRNPRLAAQLSTGSKGTTEPAGVSQPLASINAAGAAPSVANADGDQHPFPSAGQGLSDAGHVALPHIATPRGNLPVAPYTTHNPLFRIMAPAIAFLIAGLVIVGSFLFFANGGTKPVASLKPTAAPGQSWSNKDMIDHLHGRGLRFKTRIVSAAEIPLKDVPLNQRHLIEFETLVIAYPEGQDSADAALYNWVFKLSQQRPDLARAMEAHDNSRAHEAFRGSGIVFFGRAKSADKVRDEIRQGTQDLLISEEMVYTWGPWIFAGDPDEIAKIKKHL